MSHSHIAFTQEYDGDEEAKVAKPTDSFAKIVDLLGVDHDQLNQSLISTLTITRGETILRNYKPSVAADIRDAVAKALYGRTFT